MSGKAGCKLDWTPFPRRPIEQTNSEDDCLYLNVWQPLDDREDYSCDACSRPPLPAVVVLHGGLFQYGGGGGPYAFYDGKYLAAAWNAVVVVPAYRVGVFGFLNAALPEAPGNVGIRDQIAALQPLDLVAGYTRNEGAPYVLEMLRHSRLHFNDETRGGDVLASLVDWLQRHGVREPNEVLDFYGLRAPEFAAKSGTDVLVPLEELLGDMHVYCPVNYMVEEATALGSRVFAYEFAQLPYYRWWARWQGVPQLLDLVYASGLVRAIQHEYGLDHKELVFSQDMAAAFAAFVWNG
ncbi:hypothetical protein V5799_023352, partial [Amblyomma americanum]